MQGVALSLPLDQNQIILPMKGRDVDIHFYGLLCHGITVTSKEKEKQMQKIDSKRILEPGEAEYLLCPYLSEARAERYCCNSGCMAWRWRNKETEYSIRYTSANPYDAMPTRWVGKEEADYLSEKGYEIVGSRSSSGYCGYNE
jgi:hypothetical protein